MKFKKKLDLKLLEKISRIGTESLTVTPLSVFVDIKNINHFPVHLLKDTEIYPEVHSIFGKVNASDLEKLIRINTVKYIWDADAEVHHTPFTFLEKDVSPTDVRSIVLNPHGVKQPVSNNYLRGKGTVIGILDTRIDTSHPDLKGAVVKEVNCTDEEIESSQYVHGTHVASIAAGRNGVAPDSKIISYVVFGSGGGSRKTIFKGIMAAVRDGVTVMNGSFGESGCRGGCPIDKAVSYAVQSGVMFVNSAGNSGYRKEGSLTCPAGNADILTIGATTLNNKIADFSSSGPSYKDGGDKPDLCAPGEKIAAAKPGGGYHVLSGSSMAAPVVAGLYAVLTGAQCELSSDSPGVTAVVPEQIKTAFMKSAISDVDSDPFRQGKGRPDGIGALKYLIQSNKLSTPVQRLSGAFIRYAAVIAIILTALFLVQGTNWKILSNVPESSANTYVENGHAIGYMAQNTKHTVLKTSYEGAVISPANTADTDSETSSNLEIEEDQSGPEADLVNTAYGRSSIEDRDDQYELYKDTVYREILSRLERLSGRLEGD